MRDQFDIPFELTPTPHEDSLQKGFQGMLKGMLKPMVPFWGGCTTHFRTYFSGDWDVHWGYDLDFDPWPQVLFPRHTLVCGLKH